jgi:hypothetical protein
MERVIRCLSAAYAPVLSACNRRRAWWRRRAGRDIWPHFDATDLAQAALARLDDPICGAFRVTREMGLDF